MADAFDTADFYDCDPDSDSLGYTTVADAVEAYCSGDPIAVIVYAWKRASLPENFFHHSALRAVEAAEDDLLDEGLVDPDNGPDYAEADRNTAVRRIREALEMLAATKPVWHCDVVGKREFTAEQVTTILAGLKAS